MGIQVQEIIALCIVALSAALLVRHLVVRRKRSFDRNCRDCRCEAGSGEQSIDWLDKKPYIQSGVKQK